MDEIMSKCFNDRKGIGRVWFGLERSGRAAGEPKGERRGKEEREKKEGKGKKEREEESG